MTTMIEPITGEELLGYMAAMTTDLPFGDPDTEVA